MNDLLSGHDSWLTYPLDTSTDEQGEDDEQVCEGCGAVGIGGSLCNVCADPDCSPDDYGPDELDGLEEDNDDDGVGDY